MRKYLFLIPILLTVFLWVSAFATDNIGNWDGKTRSNRSVVFFTDRNTVTLQLLKDHAFSWASGDTVAGTTAGTTGVLNIADWSDQYGYFWYKMATTTTNVDVWLQSAPTDSGPWVNQYQLLDSVRSSTAGADSLDLRNCGPNIRFSFVNEDACGITSEVDYFTVKLRKKLAQ